MVRSFPYSKLLIALYISVRAWLNAVIDSATSPTRPLEIGAPAPSKYFLVNLTTPQLPLDLRSSTIASTKIPISRRHLVWLRVNSVGSTSSGRSSMLPAPRVSSIYVQVVVIADWTSEQLPGSLAVVLDPAVP